MAALPAVVTLQDCSDFSKTVEPLLPELYALPGRLLQAAQAGESLVALYVDTNPLVSGFAFSVLLGFVFLVASEVNRNYSQVDRFWSLLPTLYIAHFVAWARLAGVPSLRVEAALFYSVIWSIRLTFNYARKGGYEIGSEDYRWEIIRTNTPAFAFHILNFTFISFIQSILLFLLAAPVYPILLASTIDSNLTTFDIAYVSVELGLVLIEWFADQQQWDYQTAKKKYQKSAKVPSGFTQTEMDRGFVASGLWAWSRHPNCAAEQTIWFLLYQSSCFASNVLYSWAGAGATVLLMLFQGSTWLTEQITAGKYPEYADYRRHVGIFVPMALSPYRTPAAQPKIIRTSEIAKNQKQKQKQK